MAFEGLEAYTEMLAKEYERTGSFEYLHALTLFYEYGLSSAKWKSQRASCKKTIERLNPNFAKGYFLLKKRSDKILKNEK